MAFRANHGNRLSGGVIRFGFDDFFALGALDKNGKVFHEERTPSKNKLPLKGNGQKNEREPATSRGRREAKTKSL
jgi:hypothetical protein